MKKSRSKCLKIVDEKHDINFHWPKAYFLNTQQTHEVISYLTAARTGILNINAFI
jgi:hypothetical protein